MIFQRSFVVFHGQMVKRSFDDEALNRVYSAFLYGTGSISRSVRYLEDVLDGAKTSKVAKQEQQDAVDEHRGTQKMAKVASAYEMHQVACEKRV